MKPERKAGQPLGLIRRPRELVARLILAEALARRGKGPLARPVVRYLPMARKR